MQEFLPILSLETSAENCSVSIYTSENKFSDFNLNIRNIHSEKLFELIEFNLQSFGFSLDEIRSIAISSGPGSFTGLRIGFSAAKGIALGKTLPIIQVPSFEAMALKISKFLPNSEFIILKKATISEFYYTKFQSEKDFVYRIIEPTKMIEISHFLFLGNSTVFADVKAEKFLKLPILTALDVAIWADKYGKDLLTFDVDFIEPNYFKDFIPKATL
jgi:tRNA threonylcarbamoyladenosine biosynthesis protein TsaB